MNPCTEARLESFARKVKLPSPFGDDSMDREKITAALRRHPITQVARESGVSYPTVRKYLDGKTVNPYIEARLEDYAREVSK